MEKSMLYTRTGDRGTTALVGGSRAPKNSPRVSSYGDIDELNSHIGLLQAQVSRLPDAGVEARQLLDIQHILFEIGSYLATPDRPVSEPPLACPGTDAEAIASIEHAIDLLDSQVPPQRTFILPGGSIAAAEAHVARTVCRRAERSILTLADTGARIDPNVLIYINRLSDYLFILARRLNALTSTPDIPWTPK